MSYHRLSQNIKVLCLIQSVQTQSSLSTQLAGLDKQANNPLISSVFITRCPGHGTLPGTCAERSLLRVVLWIQVASFGPYLGSPLKIPTVMMRVATLAAPQHPFWRHFLYLVSRVWEPSVYQKPHVLPFCQGWCLGSGQRCGQSLGRAPNQRPLVPCRGV